MISQHLQAATLSVEVSRQHLTEGTARSAMPLATAEAVSPNYKIL
jgi:hypothetical protein